MSQLRRALVTGGTRGIGFEITKMLLCKNYEVVFTGRTPESVDNALTQYKHPNVRGAVLDMSNINKSVNINFDAGFDTVIHNAGMLSRDSLSTMNISKLQKMFMINTISPLLITKHCLPYMIKQKHGNIFFFCPPYRIDAKTRMLTPYMQTKLAQTTLMFSIADIVTNMKLRGVNVAGFWTHYPIYTDALAHRKIGEKENCMSPGIIAKTVELMLDDSHSNIHGSVMIDRYYLHDKHVNTKQWTLGNKTESLDYLFLKSLHESGDNFRLER